MEKRSARGNWLMLACAGVLLLVCLSILARFLLMQVAVKKLRIEGAWLEPVLGAVYTEYQRSQNGQDAKGENKKKDVVPVDWAAQYPFSEHPAEKPTLFSRYAKVEKNIQSAEKKVTEWSADHLLNYMKLVAWGKAYQQRIGWHITTIADYNNVAELGDGYLTGFSKKMDQSDHIASVAAFAAFCRSQGIPLVYLAAPSKLARSDKEYAGKLDFANENADAFLEGLTVHQIPYIDFRDNIDREGRDQRSLFFKTDHHWLPETARWAAQEVTSELDAAGLLAGDPSLLAADRFEKKVYPDIFLGSHGKKITLARTQPEDITQFLPQFPTQFHLRIPSMGIDSQGDFSILYNQKELQYGDYYHSSAYAAYNYGDRPCVIINNELADNDRHVLLIKDSFGDAFAPFLALEVRRLDILDLRYFTGSVQSFIEQHHPDVVLVLYYNAEYSNEMEVTKHEDLFDFR
ncbi:DHHW family protein [Selenomonas bovis]|uniref:DHHW family protein n=1 Tax=Selenomonas bovis TaxID=416586 RepID=UPI0004E15838|nr:DHHW family protein [Selenomonas bovis]